MCRMILGIGEVDMNILVQGIIDMANDNNAKHERNKDQIFKHGDGWGIAYTKDNKTYLKKSTGEVYSKKNDAKKYQKINSNFCIIHARKKSVGETSTLNCHPFIKQLDNEKFVFCHNGTVQEGFDIGKFKTKGTTDSEKLFLTILNKIRKLQKEKKLKTINDEIIISTIRQVLDKVVTRKGTNIFFKTKNKTYVGLKNCEFPKYYDMWIAKQKDNIIISSEKLKCANKLEWQKVKTGKILQIDNQNLKIKEYSL